MEKIISPDQPLVRAPLPAEVQLDTAEIPSKQLGRDLVKTFYLSFALSQGSENLQEIIIELAADYYRKRYGTNSLQTAVDTVPIDHIASLRVPGKHQALTIEGQPISPEESKDSVKDQFKFHWGVSPAAFANKLVEQPYRDTQLETILHNRDLHNLTQQMISRDSWYMATKTGSGEPYPGRPVSDSGRDPRASQVHDYVLEGKSIGDAPLDAILAEVREVLIEHGGRLNADEELPRGLQQSTLFELAAAWEAFHPGEHFVDPIKYAGTSLMESVQSHKA